MKYTLYTPLSSECRKVDPAHCVDRTIGRMEENYDRQIHSVSLYAHLDLFQLNHVQMVG